jgi:outer membrane receptor protein involved in Fe transport
LSSQAYQIKLQDQYAQGSSISTYSATSDESWGPRITGQQITNWKGESYTAAAQNHVDALLQTGLNVNNNISLSTGSEKAQLRMSYNNLYAKGVIPNNTQNRHSFIIRGTSDIGRLNIDVKLNYINQLIQNRPFGGEEGLNPYSDVLRMPTTVRNADLQNYINTNSAIPTNNFFGVNNAIISNPYWMVNKVQPREQRNRMIGAITLRQGLTDKLGITGRLGLDRYNDDNQTRFFAGTPTPFTANSSSGNFNLDRFSVNELNAEAFLDFTTRLSTNISFNSLLGTALRKNRSEIAVAGAGGLDLPDLFVLSNGRAVTANNSLSRQELQSIYATAQFGYRNALFLDLTGRNDWASTLPSANRSYFYPSASLSAVLSDLVTMPTWWNYLKLRNSFAFVGKDAPPYSFIQLLNASQGVTGTILRNDGTLVNPNLKPEQTRSFEVGAELGFLKSRITLDLTYYNTNSFNQIIPLPLPVSAGYNQRLINAGNIRQPGY